VPGRGRKRALALRAALVAAGLLLALTSVAVAADVLPPITIEIDDGLTASDSPASNPAIPLPAEEAIGTSDEATLLTAMRLAHDEGISVNDALAILLGIVLTTSDGVTVTDTPTVLGPVALGNSEATGVTDAITVLLGLQQTVADGGTVSDAVSVVTLGAPTSTTLTSSAVSSILAGTPVTFTATVAGARAGGVTFSSDGAPLGPPVQVDSSGVARLTTSALGVGAHTITASYGGTGDFLPSEAQLDQGVYDLSLDVAPTEATVLAGGTAGYDLKLSLVQGSATAGLPSEVPLAVTGAPPGASIDAPPSLALPAGSGHVDVETGTGSLGDFGLTFDAGGRTASSVLHLWDYALALAPADAVVQRGDTATLTVTATLLPGSSTTGGATVSLASSLGTVPATLALPGSAPLQIPTDLATPLGDSPVTVTASPGSRTATAHLFVNVPPVPDAGGPYAAVEGTPVALHGSATDADGDALTYTWDVGGVAASGADATVTAPDGPATISITLKACDDHGACATAATTLTTANAPPAVTLRAAPASVNEGGTVTLTAAVTDSAADTAAGFTYAFDCGAGTLVPAGGPTATCPAVDNPGVTARVQVTDKDGGSTIASAPVTIANVAPKVTLTAPPDSSVVLVHSPVTLGASFTDPGVLDTHTASWSVGGTTIPATVTEANGSGTAAATWTPAAAGIVPVTASVRDKDGASGSAAETLIVVDPAAGSLIGAGALASSGGKLVFAVAAGYTGSSTRPLGTVHIATPRLELESTSLSWLVVSGGTAILQGRGRIDHTPGYTFRLDAVTGHPARLRVRIWKTATGAMVLDTGGPSPLALGTLKIVR